MNLLKWPLLAVREVGKYSPIFKNDISKKEKKKQKNPPELVIFLAVPCKMPHCGTHPNQDQTQGPAVKVPSTNHWDFRQCLVSFEGGPHWPYLQMNHYPTWSILLSLRQTLLNVPSSERSFSSSFFLHSASHYLTLCLYGPFIFRLFHYLGVKRNVDRVFCFAPSHILSAWHTADNLSVHICWKKRKKAVATLHIKAPI